MQKSSLIQKIITIVTILIVLGAIYFVLKPSKPFLQKSGEPHTETIDGTTYEFQDYTPTYGQKGVR